MRVKEIMQPAVTVEETTSLGEAARIMNFKNIRTLFVVKKRDLVGVISQEDLIKHFGHKEIVSEIMNKKIVGISSNEDIAEAARMFKKYKLDKLPVIDDKKLVGVVSNVNLLEESEKGSDFLFE